MATAAGAARARVRLERFFFTGMALAILAAVLIGFAPTYYLRGYVPMHLHAAPMTPLVHLHGAVFSLWILLFVAQTSLVAAGRSDLHRSLGRFGAGLAVCIVLLGTVTAAYALHRPTAPPGISAESWLAIPLLDMPVFAILVTLGIVNRNRPQSHKRYMLVAMIGMLPPAIGRMPWPPELPPPLVIFGIPDLALLALIAWDIVSRRRVHPVTLGAGVLLIGSQVLRIAIMGTPGWIAFARWVGSLTG